MKRLLLATTFAIALTTTGQPADCQNVCPTGPCWGSSDCWECACAVPQGSIGPGVCVPVIDY